MKKIIKQNGFSLIELVIVIVLVGIIGSIGAKLLMQGVASFLTIQNTTNSTWQGQIAMERMTRDIRYVRSKVDIITMTSSEFQFVDIYGNTIDYKLTGSNLVRNSQMLANGVNSLTFTYKDRNGSVTGSAVDGMYVGITMNVTAYNTNYALTTSIFLDDLSS